MGGTEKSLLRVGGKAQISWVSDCLTSQVESLALNANGDPFRFSFLKLPVLADVVEGFVGPLAGVLTGMRWAASLDQTTHIITAAADTPFIPRDLVNKLKASIDDDEHIAMASSNGRIHPVFGLWPISLADALENFLVKEDQRKILVLNVTRCTRLFLIQMAKTRFSTSTRLKI